MASRKFDAAAFGKRVSELREARGLTQKDVADALGGYHSKISVWESGVPPRDPADLIGLAGLLGVSVDYLLTGEATAEVQPIVDLAEDLLQAVNRLRMGAPAPVDANTAPTETLAGVKATARGAKRA